MVKFIMIGVLSVVIVIGALSFMRWNDKVDASYNVENQIYQLQRDNNIIDNVMLQSYYSSNYNYDELAKRISGLKKSQKALSGWVNVEDDSSMNAKVALLGNTINKKIEAVENFKMENSILHNSMGYFATLSEKANAVTENEGNKNNKIIAQVVRDVFKYTTTKYDERIAENIKVLLGELVVTSRNESVLTSFKQHTRIILKYHAKISQVIDKILNFPVEKNLENIRKHYEAREAKEILALEIFQMIALGIFFFAAFFVAFMLYQVRKKGQAYVIAKQASQAKSVFLANMSHELRTPLHAILGYTDLVSEDIEELVGENYPEAIKSNITGINVAGEHLLNLIQDILDLSKIESGEIEINSRECTVDDLVDSINRNFLPKVSRKSGVKFLTENNSETEIIFTDKTKLQQVILNLLNNAIKYTEFGSISVAIKDVYVSDKKHLSLSVTDTGAGIRRDKLQEIFEPFQQANPEDEKTGTGLGLAICKKLTESLGGEINVESHLEKGSCFTVTVPTIYSTQDSPES